MAEPALSFAEVQDKYIYAKVNYPDQFGPMSISQFSDWMNQSLGTDKYRTGAAAKGLTGIALGASEGLEDLLSPVSGKFREAGGDIGGLFGKTGREIGESVGGALPRTAVDLGLVLGGLGLTGTGLGAAVGIPLAATGLASVGAGTFAETGSYPAAATAAATTAALPFVARAGGTAAVRHITPQIEKFIGRSFPRISEGLVREAGEQATLLGAQQVSRQAQSLVQGQGLAPVTPRTIGEDIAFNIPFLPFSVPRLAKGYRIDYSGPAPKVVPAGFRDIFYSGRGPFFPRESEAAGQAGGVVPEVAEAAREFQRVSEPITEERSKAVAKKVVPLDDPDAIEDAINEVRGLGKVKEQLVLPGEVQGKALARRQLFLPDRKLADEMSKKFEGFNPSVKYNDKSKQWVVEFDEPLKAKPAFLPEQLVGGIFGAVAAEQLNEPKPYGVARLPGDFLPGNSVLERLPKVLPKDELDMFKEAGIDKFLQGRRVSIAELSEWIDKNTLKVEVRIERGYRQDDPNIERIGAIRHEAETGGWADLLDTRPDQWPVEHPQLRVIPTDVRAMALEYHRLREIVGQEARTAVTTYPEIAPLELPVQVVMVRVPHVENAETSRIRQGGQSPLFHRGQHFGVEDVNVIGWSRIQYVDVDGKKKALIIEQQDDLIDKDASGKFYFTGQIPGLTGKKFNSFNEANEALAKAWPITKDRQRLSVKAAIHQAIREGAESIVVSDAETAMMTEGHDLAGQNPPSVRYEELPGGKIRATDDATGEVRTFNSYEEADTWKPRISQERGMRLNYDTILPKIAGELMGETGKKVDLGPHRKAFEDPISGAERFVAGVKQPRSNLIFQGPTGPKTNVSGLEFDLSGVKKELLRRGGFTLLGKDKLVNVAETLEKEGSTTEAIARSLDALAGRPIRPGETIADIAARESGLSEVINQDVPPGDFLVATHRFFDRYLNLKGEVGLRKDFLIRNAIILASKFEASVGRTRLAEVLQGPSLHLPARANKFNALIGLRTTKVLEKRELENFRILWDFGHEIGHEIEAQIAEMPDIVKLSSIHAAYHKSFLSSKTLSPEEKGVSMQGLVRHVFPDVKGEFGYKGKVYEQFKGLEPEAEASEFVADWLGVAALASANKQARDTMSDYLFFSNKETQDLTGLYLRDMTGLITAVKDYVSVSIPKDRQTIVLPALQDIHDNLVKVIEGAARADMANDAFRAVTERAMATAYDPPPVVSYKQVQRMLRMIGTPGVWVKKAETPEEVEAQRLADEQTMPQVGGKRVRGIQWLYPATQLGESIPEMKPIIDMVKDVRARVRRASEAMWQHFHDDSGKIDSDRMEKLGKTGKLRDAFSDIKLWQNVEEQVLGGEELRTFLRERHPNLTEADIALLDKSNQQSGAVLLEGAYIRIRAHQETIAAATAVALQKHNRQLTPTQAYTLATKITDFFANPPQVPPELVRTIEQGFIVEAGSRGAYDQAVLTARDSVQGDLEKGGQGGLTWLKDKLLDRPWYSPEVRPGVWMIFWKDSDGKRNLESFKTEKDASKRLGVLQGKFSRGEIKYVKSFNKLDTQERWRGLSKDDVDAMNEADSRVYNAALKSLEGVGDPETLRMMADEFQPGDGKYRIVTPPYLLPRKLVGGREQLNMMEQILNYVDATAYGTAKRWAKQQERVLLNSEGLRQSPALQNTLREYVSTFLDPQGKEWTGVKNFIFFNFMGFNLSTNLVEMTQNFLTTIPLLMRKGATFGQAFKYIVGGMTETGKAHVRGRSFRRPSYSDEETSRLIDGYESDDIIPQGVLQELYGLEDALTASRRSVMQGGEKIGAKELASNTVYHLIRMARDLYGVSTMFNARSAGIGSYRFAKEVLRLSEGDAYNFGKDIVNAALFGGGRANRPFALNGLGKATGVGGVMYALSGYTFNLLSMYARFAKEAVAGDKSARKALATMLATQGLAGGVMGLPLVSGIVAILEQLFPDAEIKKGLRTAFHSLGGDDDALGQIMSDVSMSGMFNAALPFADVGSRFQLGNLLGVDPYHGFSWGNLGGPATSMLENILKGTQKVAQGDYWNAAEKIAPAGTRGLIRMLGEEGGFRDEKGKLIIDPTPAEQFITAIGFKPKRLNQYYEQQGITKRSEEIEARRRSNLYQDLARKLLAGNREAVRTGLLKEANEARTSGGLFDPKEGLSEVIKYAMEFSTPRDVSRQGLRSNVQERSEIARLYPRGRPPSELQRYLQGKMLERTVGIPGAGRIEPRRVQEARLVDRLLATYPNLTYSEAKLAVERAFSRSPVNPPVPLSQSFVGFGR